MRSQSSESKSRSIVRLLFLVPLLVGVACQSVSVSGETNGGDPTAIEDIQARRAQFEPQDLTAKLDHLTPGDRKALGHILDAADIMDEIFRRQAWAKNPEFQRKVDAMKGPHAQATQDYYRIMYGPWDRLTGHEPFVGGLEHPEGAGYYPEDMTAEEFEEWIEDHPEDEQAFRGLHTIIERRGDTLVAVPYHEYFGEFLRDARDHLMRAARAADTASLKRYLETRAEAFMTDDYFESDVAWMDLDGDLEIVIGPYETYEDALFGYKAAYEAFICVVDPGDSDALTRYKDELPWLERSLPIPDEHKNLNRGTDSPIRVADEIYTAGDTRAGVQTLAFNLPNDERVREAKGSKKVLLKNMMQAKYDAILKPIAARALPKGAHERLDFNAYFNFILFHELSHGLGPGRITIDGRETEVRLELKDLYSPLEEAKADVLGMFSLYELVDKGVVDESVVKDLSWTVVAGLFRSARFGVTEAHGLGVVCQFSYLMEKGAMEVTADGRLAPVDAKWREGVEALTHDLLMLEANGDYAAARKFVDHYGTVPPAMQAILDSLSDIPVDIDPRYPVVAGLRGS